MFNSLKRYFCFNKSERIALFLFLLLLLFIKSFVHFIYDKKEKAFYDIIDQKIDWVAVDSAHIQSKSIENNKDISKFLITLLILYSNQNKKNDRDKLLITYKN